VAVEVRHFVSLISFYLDRTVYDRILIRDKISLDDILTPSLLKFQFYDEVDSEIIFERIKFNRSPWIFVGKRKKLDEYIKENNDCEFAKKLKNNGTKEICVHPLGISSITEDDLTIDEYLDELYNSKEDALNYVLNELGKINPNSEGEIKLLEYIKKLIVNKQDEQIKSNIGYSKKVKVYHK